MELLLTRFDATKNAIAGYITYGDFQLCSTIENKALKIPAGEYELAKYASPKFQTLVPTLLNVENRTYIHIHPANYYHQLEGCIAPGYELRQIKGEYMITGGTSRPAFAALRSGIFAQIHNKRKITLRIKDAF